MAPFCMVSGGPLFGSVDAKLARAEEHLDELERSFSDIGKGDGCRISAQHNADSTEVAIWVAFDPPPGIRWGTIIGDFGGNLRAALDHSIYAIAVHESGSDPPPKERSLQFPIADTDDDWKKVKGRVSSLSDAVRTFVEAEQPFKAAPSAELHPLSFVGALTDRDKHRTILVGASQTRDAKFTFGPRKPSGLKRVLARKEPVVDKAPLVIFRFSKPNRHVDVDVKFSFGVVLNINGVWRPALSELRRVRDGVVRVIDGLRLFAA